MLHTEFIAATASSRRLMVVLHGLGDSAAGYHWLPEALALPWMNYLLVNAPDTYYGGFSWYDYANDPAPGVLRSRQLLIELLDAQREQGFATRDTVLFGFSQGCLMTLDVGLRYPQLFAALVGISGYVFEPEQGLQELSPVARQQRIIVTHGYYDTVIPFAVSQQQIKSLVAAGLDISWHEFPKPHTIAGELELRVLRDFIVKGYPPA